MCKNEVMYCIWLTTYLIFIKWRSNVLKMKTSEPDDKKLEKMKRKGQQREGRQNKKEESDKENEEGRYRAIMKEHRINVHVSFIIYT